MIAGNATGTRARIPISTKSRAVSSGSTAKASLSRNSAGRHGDHEDRGSVGKSVAVSRGAGAHQDATKTAKTVPDMTVVR